jgi:hypothetical protein
MFDRAKVNEQDIIDFVQVMCYYLLVRPADRMLLVIKT